MEQPSLDLPDSSLMTNVFVLPCIYIHAYYYVFITWTMIAVGMTMIVMGTSGNIMGLDIIFIIVITLGMTLIVMVFFV